VTTSTTIAALAALAIAAAPAAHSAEPQAAKSTSKRAAKQIERGRYLVVVGLCNDCHTAGFAESDGNVPEKDWLKGDTLGFRGPWGTTYAANLRLSLSRMTEDQWVSYAKALKARPPMPWYSLNQWNEQDLRSFYRYLRQLGPAGEPAPQALAPVQEPKPPYILWPVPPKR
jgi:mono/diheme cytochrome c family protein